MSLFAKDPDAGLDYHIDWAATWLGQRSIAASEWRVDPVEEGGAVVAAHSHDGRRTAARIEGGIAGRVYDVANRITLATGEREERTLTLRVEQR